MGFEEKMRNKGKNLLISSGLKQRMKLNTLFLRVRFDSKPDSNCTGISCVYSPHRFCGTSRTFGARVALNGQ